MTDVPPPTYPRWKPAHELAWRAGDGGTRLESRRLAFLFSRPHAPPRRDRYGLESPVPSGGQERALSSP